MTQFCTSAQIRTDYVCSGGDKGNCHVQTMTC